jgi:excinuclease ABC subunit C
MSSQLPNKPGVYLIKDRSGRIIYVGKAISLAKRVPAHYKPDSKISPHIADVDYIITSTEIEALMLEATLIKKYRPKYNILLRDDKQYPYLKLTINEEWPRLVMVRSVLDDGAKYFGPYRSQTVKEIFKIIKRIFQIRWCKEFKKRPQPCFYYHMKKCLGPCSIDVPKEEYQRSIRDIELFLEGKYGSAIGQLKKEMTQASADRDYEVAARMRDKIKLFERISEEQKVVSSEKKDRDVFYLAVFGSYALVMILEIRQGKLVGKQNYLIKQLNNKEDADILQNSLIQYYTGAIKVPEEIVADIKNDKSVLESALTKIKGSKVNIRQPRGKKFSALYKMAEENAISVFEALLKKETANYNILLELKQELNIEKLPYRIEAFDISTTMGVETVGSMVVFEGGMPHKTDYRKFKIGRGDKVLNDVASMRNVVMRRYAGSLSKELNLPDLILIDGGLPQLNAVKDLIPKNIPVAALAKRLEEIYMPGKKGTIRIKRESPALKLLQRVRDEAHRFAITFHRKRRGKKAFER